MSLHPGVSVAIYVCTSLSGSQVVTRCQRPALGRHCTITKQQLTHKVRNHKTKHDAGLLHGAALCCRFQGSVSHHLVLEPCPEHFGRCLCLGLASDLCCLPVAFASRFRLQAFGQPCLCLTIMRWHPSSSNSVMARGRRGAMLAHLPITLVCLHHAKMLSSAWRRLCTTVTTWCSNPTLHKSMLTCRSAQVCELYAAENLKAACNVVRLL